MTTPARPGRIPDPIFVSHSHLDNEWCREFVATLTAAGWDVWYDEQGLHGGAEWLNVIQTELAARPIFMPILTPDAWASDWVQRELGLAMIEHKQIIPVLRTPTPQVSGFLRLIQWIDVVGMPAAVAAAKVALEMGYPLDRRDQPPPPPPPPDDPRFPKRLAELGYTKRLNGDDIVILPPLCDVPAGPFLMGSNKSHDPQADDNELPQHTVTLAAFQIARYPVTVAEYACYMRATGRQLPNSRLDHPVGDILGYQATDYAAWLAKTTGQPWRLPTEAEWEKAARGTNGRIYPWGDQWDKTRANTREGDSERTTPVGTYPSGVSPYGAQDMAGNVSEWTSSLYHSYPYNPAVSDDLGNSTSGRVSRGESRYNFPWDARAACRVGNSPSVVGIKRGFRLCRGGEVSTQ